MLGAFKGAAAMRALLLTNCPASLGLGSEYVWHSVYSNRINRLRHARKRHPNLDKEWRLEVGEGDDNARLEAWKMGTRGVWGREVVGSYRFGVGHGVMGLIAGR